MPLRPTVLRSLSHSLMLAAGLFAMQSSHADPVPVPANKAAYVGEWLGDKMRLFIHPDGQVDYKRDQPGKRLDVHVDLQGFNGDNFDVGTSFIRSTFVVTKPPHQEKGKDDGKWKMTVDGVELTRTQ